MINGSALQDRLAQISIFKTLRLHLDSTAEGTATLLLPYDPAYDNVFNCVHGGLLTTLADTAAYIAVLTLTGANAAITTTDLTMRFLAPCRSNVTAEAKVIKFGRTLCPVSVTLRDAHGALVAVAQVTYLRMGSE